MRLTQVGGAVARKLKGEMQTSFTETAVDYTVGLQVTDPFLGYVYEDEEYFADPQQVPFETEYFPDELGSGKWKKQKKWATKRSVEQVKEQVNNLHTKRDAIEWRSGLRVTDELQLYVKDGVEYLPDSGAVPFTTVSSFDTENWVQSEMLTGDSIKNFKLIKNTFTDNYPSYQYANVLRRSDTNGTTRLYVMPNGTPTGNVASSFKLFTTDFTKNSTDYEDFNFTTYKVLNGGAVGNADKRAVLVNLKTGQSGIYKHNASDVVFGFDDMLSGNVDTPSANIAGRMYQKVVNGMAYCGWVFGREAKILSHADVAYFCKSFGMSNNSGIRIAGADGVGNTLINKLTQGAVLEDTIRSNIVRTLDQYGNQVLTGNSDSNTVTSNVSQMANGVIDFSKGMYFKLQTSSSITLSVSNSKVGQEVTVIIKAIGGQRVITMPSSWRAKNATLSDGESCAIKLLVDGSSVVMTSLLQGL